ncbi:hypothetical protein PN498_02770 [Oscillatoria sp. CS-180]|uniref:hypothetical protein n=1 Tax=Oscillatoria sp. CS-180 TaxID=3021720 RepID=UPI00232B1644|nr:hypothetical protein [Oscillatoria sp. CS-180]MDB9524899.1 hypothetical protein [Oscillatoria sp. CS-180]
MQTLTIRLPDSIYQKLVELAHDSERPLEEETLHLLNSALSTNSKYAADIEAQLNQLSLLTDKELWDAATFAVSDEDNDLMQVLLEKRQREGLTSVEAEQVQVLSDHFNQIMMVRAQAAVILAERGHDIAKLAPSP